MKKGWSNWLRSYSLVVGAYVLATLLTDAWFMGDTTHYVGGLQAHANGVVVATNPFWDFGHLFWRPIAWIIFRLANPITTLFVGADPGLNMTVALMMLGWIGGLLSVVLMRAILNTVAERTWVKNVVTIAFICSNAFLNYAQTGCSYVPGLAFFLMGFFLLARKDGNPKQTYLKACLAGFGLAAAVCLWFPYILMIPSALTFCLFFDGLDRNRIRLVVQTSVACAVFGTIAYVAVALMLHIHSFEDFRAWLSESAHGVDRLRGVSRMAFGIARSFINMGNDGLLFKRFLVKDSLNPVSIMELFRVSLWKFGFFYLFLASIAMNLLWSPKGRRLLIWLLLGCIPILIFALFLFESGMPERYLPLYPLIFVTLAYSLDSDRGWKALKVVSVLFVCALIVANLAAVAKPVLAARQESVAVRIRDLLPRLKPKSLVAVTHLQDDLSGFFYNFPFNPINRQGTLQVYSVMEPGVARTVGWREDFAFQALSTWRAGGDVWISKRLLTVRPQPNWNWVEGDDRRISWNDLAPFFSQLELGEAIGGEDGFQRVLDSAKNRELLARLAADRQ
jgi:hypothetical protein